MEYRTLLFDYWHQIYPEVPSAILENFLLTVEAYKQPTGNDDNLLWYKDAVVYSLYADLFDTDFSGLIGKLDYLRDLGVTCIWLLPVLNSPMRDAGFDISDYYTIRPDLLDASCKKCDQEIFRSFLTEAHSRNIRVIFDVSLNHTSDEHPWFTEAVKSKNNPYRQYFIWSHHTDLYKEARIIFKGIESSNWENRGDEYYFHRFFNFQPDLNYKNPEVLLAMCRVLLFWKNLGVDGFRADATPYIWKEEGTDCENLRQTHLIVKFFRALLDYIQPGTLLLAEACQSPDKVVEYMGNGDECHAAYHFPLMPRIFKSIAMHSGAPVKETLSREFTPELPPAGQWFTFLRCHDELSLELVYVTEQERKYIHENYCHDPKWNFRMGEGISARLLELMQRDERRVLLAFSIMLTLPGTPVIYYGDEFGKLNDEDYYKTMISLTGKDDTRFLVRGRIDWNQLHTELQNPSTLSSKIFSGFKQMLGTRNTTRVFGRGDIEFVDLLPETNECILAYYRSFRNEKWLIVHNMTAGTLDVNLPAEAAACNDAITGQVVRSLPAFGYAWVKIN